MSETSKDNIELEEVFVVDETLSSAALIHTLDAVSEPAPLLPGVPQEEGIQRSPAFKELAMPKLPELQKENRAKLLMQSPNRLFFYWSLKSNPFRTLDRAFGGRTGNYTLVLKLIDLDRETEEIYPVEAEGSWWFHVEVDSRYRAEIGFYAPNGPFVRLMFSNTIETPRKSPSPRKSAEAEWTLSADAFAKVLDVSGFAQDAVDLALTGDDIGSAKEATQAAFTQFIGEEIDLAPFSPEELRFALLALASGLALETLRGQISEALFRLLEQNITVLNSKKATTVLEKHFYVSGDEDLEEEFTGSAVFGASLVNFPRLSIRKRGVPKLAPLSSFSVGS